MMHLHNTEKEGKAMKIYHKKNFKFGLWALFLAALNLAVSMLRGNFDWKDGVLIVLLVCLSVGSLIRSTTERFAKEDKVEEQDERNQLVKLKSRSQAYFISQFLFLAAETALIAAGKLQGKEMLIYIGMGLMAAFFISLLSDFFTWIYYDEHI